MKTLIRVSYGRKTCPIADREYQINGTGPVGTLSEFKAFFGNEKIHVIDKINGEDYEVN